MDRQILPPVTADTEFEDAAGYAERVAEAVAEAWPEGESPEEE